MRFIDLDGPGGPDRLRLAQGPVPRPGPGQALIEVHAAGVNRPDLAQRAGRYPPPPDASPVLGLEVAGVVVAVGAGADVRVGEAVCALAPGGGYAEYCVVPARHCLPLPEGWTMAEAAGLPETLFTVWANVFQIGRLAAGQTLLVHGGASGIGTTAIQLARAFGARTFVTAGTDAKCAACLELGAAAAINYKTQAFDTEVERLTDGRGVDVILDMVAGSYTPRNVGCLAPQGRLVQIAVQQGATVTLDIARVMQRRLTITGSTMRPRTVDDKAAIARELHERVWPLLAAKTVRVVVDRVFPLAEAAAAHTYLEAGEHIGKVILKVRD
jgi:putative PIG3 family NAD(P)H quinone oxidoreductase